MAAQVEVQTGDVGRTVAGGRLHLSPLTDSSNKSLIEINQSHIITSEPTKPVPGPKPRLTPKPFAVEKNPTIKPILAPKPQTKPRPESTRLAGYKPELPSSPKPQQPAASGKPRPLSTNPNRPAPTTYKTSNKLNTGQTPKPVVQPFKPAPPLELGDPSKPIPPVPAARQRSASSSFSKSFKKPPSAEWSGTTKNEDERGQKTPSKGGTSITRAKSMGFLVQVGQEEEDKAQPEVSVPLRPHSRGSRPRPVSAIFPGSPTKTETPVPAPRWAGRRPLSADLTSKFESLGLSLHRKSPKANTKENNPEEKAVPQRKEPDKTPVCTSIQSSDSIAIPPLPDQSSTKTEVTALKETDEEKRGVSIKSRISLLLDSSASPGTGGISQGPDPHSPVQLVPEMEPQVGVKQLIKQLTEDSTPTQSPAMKPSLKPRPLPLDLTKRFSSERSPDLLSLTEAADRHEISKDQRRVEELAVTPTDQKVILDFKDTQEPFKNASTPEEPEAGQTDGTAPKGSGPAFEVQTVRASLFENVVERRSVLMMEDEDKSENTTKDSLSSPLFDKRRDPEDGGTLVTATYKEPISPSSPLRVLHAFDTVQAVAENRAVSESVPSAQWEDKAMTLRTRRSEGGRPTVERTGPSQGPPASTAEPEPRYLRVGALQKWTTTGLDQDTSLEKGLLTEFPKEGVAVDTDWQDETAAATKRLKMLQTEEQMKPRATYFALTGQIQEPVSPGDTGTSFRDMTVPVDDSSVRSALSGSQGKILPIRRNPSLDEAFGKTSQELVEELMMKSNVASREIRSPLDRQTKEDSKEGEKKKARQNAKTKELEREKQRQLEIEKQAHIEFARMKEREMQREYERQRQKAFEKEKQDLEEKQRALERQKQIELEKQRLLEMEREKQKEVERAEKLRALERQKQIEHEKQKEQEQEREKQKELERVEKQRALERQKQIELEKQKLQEFEKEKQREVERERQRQLDRDKQRELERKKEMEKLQERERQREKERQRQREEERQRELDKERRLLEIQKEKQKMEEVERLKEIERQQLLEFQKQKQKEKERQQLMEQEKQRLREKMEREQAEKIRLMALEQEMLRMKELDKERERQREMEREKQRELEKQRQRDLERQRQLDMEKQELENQKLRQRELDKERQRKEELEILKEMERRQLLEFEKMKQAERDRQQIMEIEKRKLREKMEREEAEKMRHLAKQQEAERQRIKEKQRREEQERLKLETSPLRPKVLDLDSVLRNDQVSKTTSPRSDPATRWKEPYKPAILDIDSFTSQAQLSPSKDFPVSGTLGVDPEFGVKLQPTPERDVTWKVPAQTSVGFSSPVWTTSPQDPWELRPVEMSVDSPVAEPRKQKVSPEQLLLRQEEKLVAPHRPRSAVLEQPLFVASFSGAEPKTNSSSGLFSTTTAEQIWLPRQPQPPVQTHRRSQGSQDLNRMRSRSVSRRSAPSGSAVEGSLSRMRSRSAHREQDRHSWVQQKQSVSGEEEGKDSTPVCETDSQYGTWETGLRTDDSLTPATPSSESNLSPSPRKPTPPHTPSDQASHFEIDTLDGLPPSSSSLSSENQPFSFPDAPTTLLDTSALRSRAQLGKKRAPRTRPSRAARQTAAQAQAEGASTEDWLYRDSTEVKSESKHDDSDPEEPRGADGGPAAASLPQRIALFPGMDPSALKAQLKKRGDSDSQIDGSTPSPSQLSRSPKSPFLPRAARVLPPPGGKENGEEDSPQWLKELKSKKRLSQYENES